MRACNTRAAEKLLLRLLVLGPQLVNLLGVGHLKRALAVVGKLVLLLRQVRRLQK